MSSWNHGASSKWAEDVAMASVVIKESTSLDLPAPVTQTHRPAEANFIKTFGSSARSKGTNLFREIKKTLDAPSPDTVVRASLGDIQHKANANEGESIEDVPAACVAVGKDEIDEIVVDRSWGPSAKTSLESKVPSESDELSGVDIATVCSSLPEKILAPSNYRSRVEVQIRKFISFFEDFFNPHFPDKRKEEQYRREHWAHSKRLALWASVFFIGNWTLGAAMIPTPAVLADKIYYYAFAPCSKNAQISRRAFSPSHVIPAAVPLVFLCALNIPRDFTKSWQCLIVLSTWSWYSHSIKFYSDFFADIPAFSTFSLAVPRISPPPSSNYTTALQTVALFGLELKRFPALLGSIIFIVLAAVFIAPEKANWMRNVMNFVVFQIFLMYMHYQREMSARHLFELRIELKEQFERTQQAQLNERKTADSKYRLTSYVFHDESRPRAFHDSSSLA
ncbi:hypothetical protein D9757_011733 [Collybiopsis confluens]|uniref:Uncharacterized protein n=1 Tax=Collybiopsis confluens TaxID=2823264 RepID=A0A8H5LK36_9AGAR|nr:hypothetical protein D9757_011733 [Collybiopsis confluens]